MTLLTQTLPRHTLHLSSSFSSTIIMRTKHTAHNFEGFPVNSAAFLSEHELVLGGGGGASKSGVKNRLVC
jgi:hypothetical protein